MKDLRIIFFGTPDFAVGILKKLVDEGKNIVGIVTAPDKPAGRGRNLMPPAVKTFALSQNLNVLQPENLKNEGFINELKSLQANLQIVVAFRMLPKVVWKMPEFGTFNLHASLLPQYRGAAPINWAIINGEKLTGVTTFFIDDKIDTGAIILKREVPISENETVGGLHDTLLHEGGELVLETVALIEKGEVTTQIQVQSGNLKEAPKLTPENTKIDWNQNAKKVGAFIRGLSPYPAAWTVMKNSGEEIKIKIFNCLILEETHNHSPGMIFFDKHILKIAVKDGYVFIKELQFPGKRKMDIISFLNGFVFPENSKLS